MKLTNILDQLDTINYGLDIDSDRIPLEDIDDTIGTDRDTLELMLYDRLELTI